MSESANNYHFKSLDNVKQIITAIKPLETETYKIDVAEVYYDRYNITVTSKDPIFSNLEVEILLYLIIAELTEYVDPDFRVYNLTDNELWNYKLRHNLTALEREQLELVYRGITIDGNLLHHLSLISVYNSTIKEFVAKDNVIIQKAIFHNVIFDGCTFDDVTFLECEFVNCQFINSVELKYICFDHCFGEPLKPDTEKGIVYFGYDDYEIYDNEDTRSERTISMDSLDERAFDELFGC